MAGVPFSPELVIHLNLINFWRLIIPKKGNCTNVHTIIRLQNKFNVGGQPLELNITEIHRQYNERIY